MTTVSVGYGTSDPSHDLSLADGTTTIGLIFAGGPRVLQEIPLSPPAQSFENEQRNWIGGRGRVRFDEDPTGYNDDFFLWSTTDGKLMPSLQWRFAGMRAQSSYLPGDNQTIRWWGLYGADAESRTTRYLSVTFTPSASFAADKAYLILRRRGTPGALTFELCANSTGSPGTVRQTVTKTVSDITDTLSVYQLFDWTGTDSLTGSTVYHIKVYGAATDSLANHWEVLGDIDGTASKYSTDGSAWTAAEITMYYRITDADVAREWKFFNLEGMLYAVSRNENGTAPLMKTNGVRGTATAATSTTLTCSALTMTTNQFAGAYIWIYDGLGETQIRQIISNTATEFTVAAWGITPDTTSRFVVYSTAEWVAVTGTHGLTNVFSQPISTGKVAYFPHSPIRRMQVNGNSHDFSDDAAYVHVLGTTIENATLKVVGGRWDTGAILLADAPAWGVNLTFGAEKAIGTQDYRITNILYHNKVLYIFKEDGLYTYSNGLVEKLGNNFASAPDHNLGIGAAAQDQYLWFGWSHSAERMLGSNVDDMLNFKRGYEGMPADRRGNITSIVSAIGWLFFVVDGGTTNYSSIMVWNGMGWHEIFRGWAAGVRIRNAVWQPNIGAKGRLWFDIAGDLAYIEFPANAANPQKDTTINYNWEGAVVTSIYDAHDQNLYKILSLLRVFLELVNGFVYVDYQTDAAIVTNTWTVLGRADSWPVEDLELNLGSVFQIRFRFRLETANTRVPPLLSGWQLSGRMMPLDKYQFLGTFKTDSDQTTFTDEPDHNPNTLYSQLQTWAQRQTKLTLRSATLSSDQKIVTVALPSKSVDWIDSGENKWGGRITTAILET